MHHFSALKFSSTSDFKNDNGGDARQRRLALTNIVKLYFDFVYYLAICPFHFARNGTNEHFYVKTWRPQQALCATLHILCILHYIAQIRVAIPINVARAREGDPYPYFTILLKFCSLFCKLASIYAFWRRKDCYLKIVNFILKDGNLPTTSRMIIKPFWIHLLLGAFTLKALVSFVTGFGMIAPIGSWSPSLWFRRIVEHARLTFCFKDKATEPPQLGDISFWDVVLAVPMAMAKYERYVLAEFCDICILTAALTLWTVASSFANNIDDTIRMEDEWDDIVESGELPKLASITVRPAGNNQTKSAAKHPSPWPVIYRNFQAIQKLSGIINAALGSQVTWYMAEGLVYYSIYLNNVLLTKDNFKRVHDIVFYALTFNILYISASICTKMESARQWLIRNNNIKIVPADEANLVLHEALIKDIGIQGSNMFTITFPLVAGFLSLFVTFFVICVQSKS